MKRLFFLIVIYIITSISTGYAISFDIALNQAEEYNCKSGDYHFVPDETSIFSQKYENFGVEVKCNNGVKTKIYTYNEKELTKTDFYKIYNDFKLNGPVCTRIAIKEYKLNNIIYKVECQNIGAYSIFYINGKKVLYNDFSYSLRSQSTYQSGVSSNSGSNYSSSSLSSNTQYTSSNNQISNTSNNTGTTISNNQNNNLSQNNTSNNTNNTNNNTNSSIGNNQTGTQNNNDYLAQNATTSSLYNELDNYYDSAEYNSILIPANEKAIREQINIVTDPVISKILNIKQQAANYTKNKIESETTQIVTSAEQIWRSVPFDVAPGNFENLSALKNEAADGYQPDILAQNIVTITDTAIKSNDNMFNNLSNIPIISNIISQPIVENLAIKVSTTVDSVFNIFKTFFDFIKNVI